MTLDLPAPLHDFIAAGGDPRQHLGNSFASLLDCLVDAAYLDDIELRRCARLEMFCALEHAAGRDVVPRREPMTDTERRISIDRDRWAHDLLSDANARTALLGLLDRAEVAQLDEWVEAARRPPAPLRTEISDGTLCDGCGTPVPAGAIVLTLGAEEEPDLDQWRWCSTCVSTAAAVML